MEVITSYLAVLRDPSVPSNRVARAPPGGPGANDDKVKMLRHAPPCLHRTARQDVNVGTCRIGSGPFVLGSSYRKMHFSDPESSHSSRISESGEGT